MVVGSAVMEELVRTALCCMVGTKGGSTVLGDSIVGFVSWGCIVYAV